MPTDEKPTQPKQATQAEEVYRLPDGTLVSVSDATIEEIAWLQQQGAVRQQPHAGTSRAASVATANDQATQTTFPFEAVLAATDLTQQAAIEDAMSSQSLDFQQRQFDVQQNSDARSYAVQEMPKRQSDTVHFNGQQDYRANLRASGYQDNADLANLALRQAELSAAYSRAQRAAKLKSDLGALGTQQTLAQILRGL